MVRPKLLSGLPRREHRLGIHIAALGDASAGRIALGDEDGTLLLALVLGVAEMDAAVAELAIVEIRLLGTLTGEFGNARHRLALAFALLNLILQNLSYILVDMEIVVYFLLQEIAHILIDGFTTIRRHRSTSELNLGLTLNRFFYVDGNGSHQSVSDVSILILAVELLDSLGNMLMKAL